MPFHKPTPTNLAVPEVIRRTDWHPPTAATQTQTIARSYFRILASRD
ncbi:MAG: hypothetical protein ACK5EO_05835 [Planctomycetota bacterium]